MSVNPAVTSARRAPRWRRYVTSLLGAELAALCRHCDRAIEWLPRDGSRGELLAAIGTRARQTVAADEPFPDLSGEEATRTAVIVVGAFNHESDIQGRLQSLRPRLARGSRLLIVLFNPYLAPLYRFANWLGIRRGELPDTFVTRVDLANLARLAGFEIVRQRPSVFVPWRWWGLGTLLNRMLPAVPLLRWLALTVVVTMRPLRMRPAQLGVSCVVPLRNERGNIAAILDRIPDFGCPTEIIFVEGHSTDGSWEELQRVIAAHDGSSAIVAMRQLGEGKADAVRLGLSRASQPLLMILDADLTVPPEMLVRFHSAYLEGHGDFVNGSRLVYPMDAAAMRFLNRLANIFFAKALSWILDARIGDALCGTKVFSKVDYDRMAAWRERFGDFDPFGDFELLLPAAELGLGIVDVPVRYRARTYGETKIRRIRQGLQLLWVAWVGIASVKLGKRPA